eukprot:jgi/Mesvir1/28094/Mv04681-RA.2
MSGAAASLFGASVCSHFRSLAAKPTNVAAASPASVGCSHIVTRQIIRASRHQYPLGLRCNAPSLPESLRSAYFSVPVWRTGHGTTSSRPVSDFRLFSARGGDTHPGKGFGQSSTPERKKRHPPHGSDEDGKERDALLPPANVIDTFDDDELILAAAAALSRRDARDGGADSNVDAAFMDSVIKIFCTHSEPNYSLPWQRKRQYASTGSGFMISGRMLLTNAHCVDHHTQVKVKKRGDDTKFVAKVLALGTECDLALLTVEDDEFWKDASELQFGSLPCLQDAVLVVGYPVGGDTISVTSGVVSRIEVMPYAHGSSELLGIQIDAAINPGNSGGPAFNSKGECVGIAFQSLRSEDTENIGYVIPTPVINHFLTDYIKNGRYTGFPILGIEWQKSENPALRACVGMSSPSLKGVMVRRVEPTSDAYHKLQKSDIILKFDGTPIANDGTVAFRTGERISFCYLVSQKYTNETAHLEVLRDGQHISLDVTLSVPERLVPTRCAKDMPSYLVVGGLVFTACCEPYLREEYGEDYMFDSPVSLHILVQLFLSPQWGHDKKPVSRVIPWTAFSLGNIPWLGECAPGVWAYVGP